MEGSDLSIITITTKPLKWFRSVVTGFWLPPDWSLVLVPGDFRRNRTILFLHRFWFFEESGRSQCHWIKGIICSINFDSHFGLPKFPEKTFGKSFLAPTLRGRHPPSQTIGIETLRGNHAFLEKRAYLRTSFLEKQEVQIKTGRVFVNSVALHPSVAVHLIRKTYDIGIGSPFEISHGIWR